jgi:NDP-mannose synthase
LTTALIMAGGQGERMRAAGASTPKPLVPIRRVPLLERNLLTLLRWGFHDIVVAAPAHTPAIADFVRGRCKAVAAAQGAHLRLFEETTALGNIGAAAEVERCDGELLVVYADNLTSLDLTALVRHHRHADAALTSAVHLEPFRIPFGEVEVRDGLIVAYHEKPERRVLIASGLFVLGPTAIAHIPRGRSTGVSWLANRLLAAGERVAAFAHDAPWIDVNDVAAIGRAEQLVADAEAFQP